MISVDFTLTVLSVSLLTKFSHFQQRDKLIKRGGDEEEITTAEPALPSHR